MQKRIVFVILKTVMEDKFIKDHIKIDLLVCR